VRDGHLGRNRFSSVATPRSTHRPDGLVPGHLDGTYLWHYLTYVCGGNDMRGRFLTAPPPSPNQGKHAEYALLWITTHRFPNADGSFSISNENETIRGIFATEGGRTVIRDGVVTTNCGQEAALTNPGGVATACLLAAGLAFGVRPRPIRRSVG